MRHLAKYVHDLGRVDASVQLVARDDEGSARPSALTNSVGVIPNNLFHPAAQLSLKAGDRIRTGDVQLGKLAFYH